MSTTFGIVIKNGELLDLPPTGRWINITPRYKR